MDKERKFDKKPKTKGRRPPHMDTPRVYFVCLYSSFFVSFTSRGSQDPNTIP